MRKKPLAGVRHVSLMSGLTPLTLPSLLAILGAIPAETGQGVGDHPSEFTHVSLQESFCAYDT